MSINEDTEIRRLTFATRSTVECPAAGAGLPSNVVSINVEEPRNPTITTNPGTTVCAEDVTNLVFTANTIVTLNLLILIMAINAPVVTMSGALNGYATKRANLQVDTLGDMQVGWTVVTVG